MSQEWSRSALLSMPVSQSLVCLRCIRMWTSLGQTTGHFSQQTMRSVREPAHRTLAASSLLLRMRTFKWRASGNTGAQNFKLWLKLNCHKEVGEKESR